MVKHSAGWDESQTPDNAEGCGWKGMWCKIYAKLKMQITKMTPHRISRGLGYDDRWPTVQQWFSITFCRAPCWGQIFVIAPPPNPIILILFHPASHTHKEWSLSLCVQLGWQRKGVMCDTSEFQETEVEVADVKMLRFSLRGTRTERLRNEHVRWMLVSLGDKKTERRDWNGSDSYRGGIVDKSV